MPFMPTTRADRRLNYVRAGIVGKPLVVLIHAVGTDLTYWDNQFGALAAQFEVVGYDLIGHGASSRPSGGYTLQDHATDLAALINGLQARSAHLVGLSVGGMIAQTLAVSSPTLVRSLTLIDTVATFSDEVRVALRQRATRTRTGGMQAVLEETIQRWFTTEFLSSRPDVIDRVSKTLMQNSPPIHAAMWDAIARLELAAFLPSMTCPTSVIVGSDDKTTPITASQLIADRIPNATLNVIKGAAHLAPIERPAEINALLLAFLGSH